LRNAIFLSVDRAGFPPAVFAAHTAKINAPADAFDTVIAVPENVVEPLWIHWAEANVGAVVREVSLVEHIGFQKTANRYIPPSTAYRYLFDLFLPSHYDKLIYLDADVRVLGDLSRLFELDLGGHVFAACPDAVVTAYEDGSDPWTANYIAKLGWDLAVTMVNPGLLVIDPRRWLEKDLGRRVMADLREHIDVYLSVDQDALNLLVRGAFQPISPVWNMLTMLWLAADFSDVISPSVLHYAGPQKPWKVKSWGYDQKEILPYREFFRSSPWPDLALSLWRESPTWKECRRYYRRLLKRTVMGRWPLYPASNVEKYKDHIRSFDFADKRQRLVACDATGVLRAAGAAAGP